MQEGFKLATLAHTGEQEYDLSAFSMAAAQQVRAFHARFPQYTVTPLVSLEKTAKALGLGALHVKDESFRFGLNAFKVLGGSYAIGRVLAQKLGISMEEATFERLAASKETLGELTFVTATDGNHGRGVAWAAKRFGHRAVVYMPKGTAQQRLDNILAEDADAAIMDFNYDECVRLASRKAQENGWIVVQDTAWEGYEEIPGYIMQGYMTMAQEAFEQLPEKPTHLFLQAGVGSMAAAVAAFFASAYGKARPTVTIIEPNRADCLYRTALANDGKRHFVTGDMNTIMAGLACGEPCSTAWEILAHCADHFLSCPEYAAATGMRILGNPMKGDARVISGESGASAFGCVAELMMDERLSELREKIGLDACSRVLVISTEGDTCPEMYRAIVWGGAYPRG